jgi:acetylglutamate kinase
VTDILVAKIGGSTLGSHDTTLSDVVSLQQRGVRPVIVHGGGALVSDWLKRANVSSRFERGLRVTDADTLEVVVAVLAGLVNKELVARLTALGGRALGISGADGGILRARIADPDLGFVGDIMDVDTGPIMRIVDDGMIPVIAPVAAEWVGEGPTGQLLNTNADTAAGAIGVALKARWLAFLTDVDGVRNRNGEVESNVSADEASDFIRSGVIEGGMIPKVEACLTGVRGGCSSIILDGRRAGALLSVVDGNAAGTIVG